MSEYQNDLKHIRNIMERSTTFLSLSGLSGVGAGIAALAGVLVTFFILDRNQISYFDGQPNAINPETEIEIAIVALITLILGLTSGLWFSWQKSQKQNLPFWTVSAKELLLAGAMPLLAGGLFSIILWKYDLFFLIAPAMLIFYGLGLLSASKYTHKDIFYLGFCEVVLGLIAALIPGYGLIFWGIGFGILHIFYGTLMYYKYK
jgi:hypothetical protein